ncbi:GntR family transcriptional regulator [Fusobacterium polymorphum]|uniref:GntR family transcriptional regulator n=2 Tax=Fusobacterium nucleatum subsp. polymorphum TaxID=76857 RepID=A0A2C6AUN7_FUSNP|nr:GntR family transcriptional regulator [Fusobacterium polymorphum]
MLMSENLFGNIVYQKIKIAILNEMYEPNQILNERKLAEEFQISRTPVREALKILEGEGWVKIIPWKGAIVNKITQKEIDEIFQIRLIIEPAIIELLQNKIDYKKRAYLDKLYENQKKAKTKKEFILADREFHMTFAEWTENLQLIEMVKGLNDKIYMVGHKAINSKDSKREEETLEEHYKIIQALKNNDIMMAKNFMIAHVIETKNNINKNI